MKIIQILEPGRDCPANLAGNKKFQAEIAEVTRRRLGLRAIDEVEVVFL